MAKVVFAVLAHHKRACLEDLVLNLRVFAPESDIVLFNGGKDPQLAEGLDIAVCPYSRPMRYDRLGRVQLDTMRWLYEEGRAFDFLVTLDSDMLLIKPGFEQYLSAHMANSAYMAVLFREIPPWTNWKTGRRFHTKWERIWQPIFGTNYPYGCFNPAQVFRYDYVERLMSFPKLDELLSRIDHTSLFCIEEMVYATLAVTLVCEPRRYAEPWSSAIRYRKRHSPHEIRAYLGDPDVFFIHPVPVDMDAPERRLLAALRDGTRVDFDEFQAAFDSDKVELPLYLRLRSSLVTPVLSKLHDAYLWMVPE